MTRAIAVFILVVGFGTVAVFAQNRPVNGPAAQAADEVTAIGGGTSHGSAAASKTTPLRSNGSAVRLDAGPAIALLGNILTPSPAQSVAVNGNFAYVCNNNEISIVNISNPAALQSAGMVPNGLIHASDNIYCSIQRSSLAVFSDQNSSTAGNTPAFLAFNLGNPTSPQLIGATTVDKRFFGNPAYIGNYAYVPTWAIKFSGPTWETQFGDLLSVDLNNFATPQVVNTLEQPQLSPQSGGSTVVMGATQADTSLVYIGGSTSTLGPGTIFGTGNQGSGRLQVVDVSNPSAMQLVGQLLIPGTKQVAAPQIQGTVGVAIGNNGGFSGSGVGNEFAGNVVVVTFDISDRRQPSILSVTATTYKPFGDGSRGTRIGNNVFAFPRVKDANNNPVLLIVDASDPNAPAITSIPASQGFTGLLAIGNRLYATLGTGGFSVYSIPGIDNTPLSVCPVTIDTALVLDQGAAMPPQAFLDAKAALRGFIDSLHLPSDHVAVVSFNTAAVVNQSLTSSSTTAKSAFNSILAGGTSYLGAGIAAAQAELTGPNHSPGAFQVMVILSDGSDQGAPNSNASAAAAASAKAAGIRIISLQYGAIPNALMQGIATSPSDYHLIGQ